MLAWLERLDASGLDGRDLTEIGLRRQPHVDDQRNGKQWTFTNIDLASRARKAAACRDARLAECGTAVADRGR